MSELWSENYIRDAVKIQKGKKPPSMTKEASDAVPYLTADVLRGSLASQFIENSAIDGCVELAGNETVILWDGAGAGDIFQAQRGVLASTMAKATPINPEELSHRYLYYLLQSHQKEIKSSCRGTTVPHVSPEALKEIKVFIPTILVQKRIVDLVTSVDNYINALQQQAEAARTARNAVLHELLTTTGDDWVETTLGHVAKWGSGGTPKSGNSLYYDGEIPWCVIGDLTEGEVFATEKTITDEGLKNSSAKIVQPGAVMIAMYGASIGRTGMVGVPMATNQAIAFAYCHEELIDNRFLLIFLQTQKTKFVDAGQGAAQPNISQTVLKDWPIALPPLPEQKRIVEIVSSMEDVIQAAEELLNYATNLRSGLLSDLLSGNHEIPKSYDSFLEAV